MPGWATTASDTLIELWHTGFNGVPAGAGTQFAELNATQPSTLYQDVATTPGETIEWSLFHRGRSGVDVMRVIIGPPGGPLLAQGADISDGTTAWGRTTRRYTVPAGADHDALRLHGRLRGRRRVDRQLPRRHHVLPRAEGQ